MIKNYLLYLITGLLTFWVILFLFGVSAGFANYAPVLALLGSVLLFSIASPILVISRKLGLWLGLIGLLLLFPFYIGFTISVFEDGLFNWGALLGLIPITLVLLALFCTVKEIRVKVEPKQVSKITRVVMIAIPILILIAYIFFYGKYWTWQIFSI